MCDEEWDIYEALEELLYVEALRYYHRGDLGGLRELEVRAARLGVDEVFLSRISELRAELEERLLRRMEESLGGGRAARVES